MTFYKGTGNCSDFPSDAAVFPDGSPRAKGVLSVLFGVQDLHLAVRTMFFHSDL